MKVFKFIFSLILYTYGLFYFFLIALSVLFFTLIRLNRDTWDPWFKSMMRFLFRILFLKVSVEGTSNIQKDKAYIFMPNHISFIDIPFVAGFIPVFFRAVEAHHHFSWPVYGWATRSYGNIPISRTHFGKSMQSYNALTEYLNNKKSVLIFPEGHRTLDGKMLKFKKLPFYITQQTDVEIIPIGISGMYGVNPKGKLIVNITSPLKLKFGEPISREIINSKTPDELSKYVQAKVAELIERP
ncbi:MAG: 1-acyl-sn-glycerol-3-phosphate acyltransferase, partial [Bacteroidales bacterium]|nr:1-acyl-sn-glycerol-3-phosphate acyltransferase [Bacteroidales bacterium]